MATQSTTSTIPPRSKATPLGKLEILPPELRLEIFDLVLDDFFVANKGAIVHCEKATGDIRPALLNTSKAIRGQACKPYIRRADSLVDTTVEINTEFWRTVNVQQSGLVDGQFNMMQALSSAIRCAQIWRKGEVREMKRSGCMDVQEYVVAIQKIWKTV